MATIISIRWLMGVVGKSSVQYDRSSANVKLMEGNAGQTVKGCGKRLIFPAGKGCSNPLGQDRMELPGIDS
ncbi:MAG TPA: hypothetical protein ENI62_15330 [Gammaproteobacteria bacterium]|nr:hypothetical protein [Gammaproteobacteria bacterium]